MTSCVRRVKPSSQKGTAMEINSIRALNFMRVGEIDVDLSGNAIHLFCGHNEAGKTTLQEAIRLAAFGETVRVDKKGDYKLMIKDGAKTGNVEVVINGVKYKRDVSKGALVDENVVEPPEALKFALDAHLFSRMDDKLRRKFLFRALDISLKPKEIKERMLKRDIDEECIDGILPLLLSGGFGGAHTEAKKKTTEARGVWKGITNETYGSVKADTWKAEPQFTDEQASDLVDYKGELSECNDRLDALMVEKGALEATPAKQKAKLQEGIRLVCCNCNHVLMYKMGRVTPYEAPVKTEDEPEAAPSQLDNSISFEKQTRDELQAKILQLEIAQARDEDLDTLTQSATDAHEMVVKWKALEDLIAPEGLPAEIISEAITPLNDRLKETAAAAGWKQCQIDPTMNITMDGRIYSLQSESSKWRCDAMMAEAISHLTGTKVLVLDRVDVLDMNSRMQLIKWMLSVESEYSSILLFATLKEPPTMPAKIAVHWMENGSLAEEE